MPINITPEQQDEITRYCKAIVPEAEIFAYGSRVTGTAKPSSDLDLALKAETTINPEHIFQLENTLKNSFLPFRVEVIDLNSIDAGFLNAIEDELVKL